MSKRIMIVDDTAVMRLMLRRLLEKNGYEVCAEASTGTEAVENYVAYKPDLVTMDLTMPEMDGITAVRKIIQFDSKAIIIMCSAMGQMEKVKAAIIAGARDFLVKPLQPERVLATIQKLVGE